jgi:D-aminopeptidase
MKTKELIRQLQEGDPTGDQEVSVGNTDIHFVSVEPAYYDGCQEVLVRDEKEKCYNIIGARVVSEGDKVVIHTLGIHDAIMECFYKAF